MLDDDHPTQAFLNIESRKKGCHALCKISIKHPKNDTKQSDTANYPI